MIELLSGLRLISKLSCSVFSGASIYVNLVEHPARMQCGTRVALTQFKPSFKRALNLQASLCVVGSVTALAAYFLDQNDKNWLYSGLLMASILPYTIIFIKPVFTALLDENIDQDSDRTKRLLNKWNKLHAGRSVLSFAAIFVMFYYG